MAWRFAARTALVAMMGLGACGRTGPMFNIAETDVGVASSGDTAAVTTAVLDTGSRETEARTSGPDSGFDTSVLDEGPLDTGFGEEGPFTTGAGTSTGGTSTSGTSTSGTSTTSTTSTSGGSDDMGSATSGGGTTDGGTTSGGTTGGSSSSDGGSTTTGDDYTCSDAVDCVFACGVPSGTCTNMCDDGLSPADDADFSDFQNCIILNCFFNGSCFGGPGSMSCIACRVGGLVDPMSVGCEDEAMVCLSP